MQLDRRFLGWGVFFVVLGAVPLAVRQGLVTQELVAEAWDLWPLILIGIGVGLVLRRTPFEALGGLIVAATFGLLLGAGIATGTWRFGSFGGCGSGDAGGQSFAPVEGQLGGEATVELEVDCGSLTLAPSAGSGFRLDGEDEDGRGPTVRAERDSLEVQARDGGGFLGGSRDTWRLSLGAEPRYGLTLAVNAGSAVVDLSSMRVPTLDIEVNAAEVTVDMAEVLEADALTASANAGTVRIALPLRDLRGSVSANAGSVELCLPDGVGLRLRTSENITASYDVGRAGLVETDDGVFESPDYGSAEVRVELEASANAGSISLDPEGGCRG
jgi:hypothetical protein